MKKIIFFLLLSLASATVHAQLNNTKWKGTIQLENKVDVVFDYRQDTLTVSNNADNSNIETMTYAVKDSVITLHKIYGQSECNATVNGKYKYQIKDDSLYMILLSDSCKERSDVLNNSAWSRIK
jgi:hypothetical protein